jgi:hypothetical protein
MREFLVTFFLPALVMNLVLELLVVEVNNARKTLADVCGHNLATGRGFSPRCRIKTSASGITPRLPVHRPVSEVVGLSTCSLQPIIGSWSLTLFALDFRQE